MVYQDFARYQISLEDNIALGNVLQKDQTKIREAAEAMGLGQTIAGLPPGMETPLGKIKEQGVDLSGGQWQRLAIARVFSGAMTCLSWTCPLPSSSPTAWAR